MSDSEKPKKRIVFFHPDLGIGGAERLVIDAAVGLQELGHKVTVFTSHCDPSHCFTEARDGTLDVRVRGNTIVPPSIAGRFTILCAILRQLHLVLSIAIFSSELKNLRPTDLFIDQLSACLPLLKLLDSSVRVLFYCHFPDQLLVQDADGTLGLAKSVYRIPFNWLESWSTSCGDAVVVNSKFTGGVVKYVFPALKKRILKVIYPCVDTALSKQDKARKSLWPGKRILLSINRFERKKDVALAIKAYAALSAKDRRGSRLVIAGGYDSRMEENVSYHKDLKKLATDAKLSHATFQKLDSPSEVSDDADIIFLLSVPDTLKQSLLDSASLLIYTPQYEHFGIVPLEAMLNSVPVLAANRGGPLETVVEGETGWLRDVSDTPAWTEVMRKVLELTASNPSELAKMGEAGRVRVTDNFSKRKMALRFEKVMDENKAAPRVNVFNVLITTIILMTIFAVVFAFILKELLFYMLKKDLQREQWWSENKASVSAAAASMGFKGEL